MGDINTLKGDIVTVIQDNKIIIIDFISLSVMVIVVKCGPWGLMIG